jgi:hypothetical protein
MSSTKCLNTLFEAVSSSKPTVTGSPNPAIDQDEVLNVIPSAASSAEQSRKMETFEDTNKSCNGKEPGAPATIQQYRDWLQEERAKLLKLRISQSDMRCQVIQLLEDKRLLAIQLLYYKADLFSQKQQTRKWRQKYESLKRKRAKKPVATSTRNDQAEPLCKVVKIDSMSIKQLKQENLGPVNNEDTQTNCNQLISIEEDFVTKKVEKRHSDHTPASWELPSSIGIDNSILCSMKKEKQRTLERKIQERSSFGNSNPSDNGFLPMDMNENVNEISFDEQKRNSRILMEEQISHRNKSDDIQKTEEASSFSVHDDSILFPISEHVRDNIDFDDQKLEVISEVHEEQLSSCTQSCEIQTNVKMLSNQEDGSNLFSRKSEITGDESGCFQEKLQSWEVHSFNNNSCTIQTNEGLPSIWQDASIVLSSEKKQSGTANLKESGTSEMDVDGETLASKALPDEEYSANNNYPSIHKNEELPSICQDKSNLFPREKEGEHLERGELHEEQISSDNKSSIVQTSGELSSIWQDDSILYSTANSKGSDEIHDSKDLEQDIADESSAAPNQWVTTSRDRKAKRKFTPDVDAAASRSLSFNIINCFVDTESGQDISGFSDSIAPAEDFNSTTILTSETLTHAEALNTDGVGTTACEVDAVVRTPCSLSFSPDASAGLECSLRTNWPRKHSQRLLVKEIVDVNDGASDHKSPALNGSAVLENYMLSSEIPNNDSLISEGVSTCTTDASQSVCNSFSLPSEGLRKKIKRGTTNILFSSFQAPKLKLQQKFVTKRRR